MITERRKNLILAISDGNGDVFPFIHQLESAARREEVYQWFLKNKITGAKFIAFFAERRFSKLKVLKDVLTAIDGKQKEAIIGGVDI